MQDTFLYVSLITCVGIIISCIIFSISRKIKLKKLTNLIILSLIFGLIFIVLPITYEIS